MKNYFWQVEQDKTNVDLTRRLKGLRHHVVDEPVCVGDASSLELLLVLILIDLLEDILEAPVVYLSRRQKHNEHADQPR